MGGFLLIVKKIVIVACLVMAGCSRPSPYPSPAATAVASAPAAVSAPPAAPAPQPDLRATVAVARFEKGTLSECDDTTITMPAAAGQAALSKLVTSLLKDTGTRIAKPCSEQFADRPLLATCNVSKSVKGDAGPGFAFDGVTNYYDLTALQANDESMKDCLEMAGTWWAAPKESPAFRQAIRTRLRREATDLQHAAQQMADQQ